MKNIIEKWLEVKKIKYEKKYCKHEWEEKMSWNSEDTRTGAKHEKAIILLICKKCGEIKKIEAID